MAYLVQHFVHSTDTKSMSQEILVSHRPLTGGEMVMSLCHLVRTLKSLDFTLCRSIVLSTE